MIYIIYRIIELYKYLFSSSLLIYSLGNHPPTNVYGNTFSVVSIILLSNKWKEVKK